MIVGDVADHHFFHFFFFVFVPLFSDWYISVPFYISLAQRVILPHLATNNIATNFQFHYDCDTQRTQLNSVQLVGTFSCRVFLFADLNARYPNSECMMYVLCSVLQPENHMVAEELIICYCLYAHCAAFSLFVIRCSFQVLLTSWCSISCVIFTFSRDSSQQQIRENPFGGNLMGMWECVCDAYLYECVYSHVWCMGHLFICKLNYGSFCFLFEFRIDIYCQSFCCFVFPIDK